jgi:hypothetical protein
MPGPRSPLAASLVLSDAEQAALEHLVRATTTPQGVARRARMVLLVAAGHSISETARRVETQRWIVGQWVGRFQADRLEGLTDRPRSGRPAVFPPLGGGPHRRPGLHAAR